MQNKLAKIAKAGEQAITETGQQKIAEMQGLAWAVQMGKHAGAAEAIDIVSNQLQSLAIRGWIQFAEAEGYRAEGFDSMASYLDHYRPNQMDHNEYYRRKALLEKEGDVAFDLLNSLGVPKDARRFIDSGDFAIEGDSLRIGDKSASIDDKKGVRQLWNEAADAFGRAEEKAEKERKKLEKLLKRGGFVFEVDDNGKEKITPPPSQTITVFDKTSEGDPANQAYLKTLSSLAELQRNLLQLESAEADQRLAQYKPELETAFANLLFFAASTSPTRRPDSVAAIDGLSEEDLAALAEE